MGIATETISQNTFDRFETLTKRDIKPHIQNWIDFTSQGVNDIANYYQGLLGTYPTDAIQILDSLKNTNGQFLELFRVNASNFTAYEDWILLELVEDIDAKLDTIINYSKWLRAPIVNGLFGGFGMELEYSMQQGQTLENVSSQVVNDTEPQNDWVNIALRNKLREEDYTFEGGSIIKVNGTSGQNIVFLDSVVDNIDSIEKTYGVDINRVIEFVDEDLNILTPKETIQQAADILIGLERGDNPFHLSHGYDKKLVVGNSLAAISYPVIVRQIIDTFATDDTFSSISLQDIKKDKDGIFMEFDIETTAGTLIQQGVFIN